MLKALAFKDHDALHQKNLSNPESNTIIGNAIYAAEALFFSHFRKFG
jgi:hypothetical protein